MGWAPGPWLCPRKERGHDVKTQRGRGTKAEVGVPQPQAALSAPPEAGSSRRTLPRFSRSPALGSPDPRLGSRWWRVNGNRAEGGWARTLPGRLWGLGLQSASWRVRDRSPLRPREVRWQLQSWASGPDRGRWANSGRVYPGLELSRPWTLRAQTTQVPAKPGAWWPSGGSSEGAACGTGPAPIPHWSQEDLGLLPS